MNELLRFELYYDNTRSIILLGRDGRNLWEREFEQNLLLIVDHVDTGPIDSDNDVILGKVRAC